MDKLLPVLLFSVASLGSWVLLNLSANYMPEQDNAFGYDCTRHIESDLLGRIDLFEKLGHGGFSLVLRGLVVDQNLPVAVKVGMTPDSNLYQEREILGRLSGSPGFPTLFGSGTVTCVSLEYPHRLITHECLVLELLVEPVNVWSARESKRMSPSKFMHAILTIGMKIVDALQVMHERAHYAMHDLHPGNVMLTESGEVKLIDFGEAVSIDFNFRVSHRLNAFYTSLREEMDQPVSQRDDIERLVYVLVYMLRQKLPWQDSGTICCNKSLKFSLTEEEICKGFPDSITQLLRYARTELEFGQIPDHSFVSHMLQLAMEQV